MNITCVCLRCVLGSILMQVMNKWLGTWIALVTFALLCINRFLYGWSCFTTSMYQGFYIYYIYYICCMVHALYYLCCTNYKTIFNYMLEPTHRLPFTWLPNDSVHVSLMWDEIMGTFGNFIDYHSSPYTSLASLSITLWYKSKIL